MTPSAISHQVKSLESFLGIQLFERKPRKIELTKAGKDYLEEVSKAFWAMELATQQLVTGHKGGELKLAVAPAFLDRWLLPRFNDFTDMHPDIDLDIHSSIGVIDFNQKEIDMAVYFGDGTWPNIECTLLRSSYLVPVCSPKLLAQKQIDKPSDLLKVRLLQVKKRPEEWNNWFELSDIGYKPKKGTMSFSNGMLTANAAMRGMGVALTDPSLVADEIKSGELVVPIDIVMRLSKSFYLVSQKGRQLTYAMSVFQNWIIERMEEDKREVETQ